MKTLIPLLALLLLVPISTRSQERIIREYDRFEDRTRYWTAPSFVRSGLEIRGYFSFKGKGAGHEVNGFSLIFTSTSTDWRYLKDSRLYCLIDGHPVELGSARARDGDVKVGYSSVEVQEKLVFPLRYQTLRRIAEAKRVDMRLGNTEFHLDQYFRESLKELLNKVRVVKNK